MKYVFVDAFHINHLTSTRFAGDMKDEQKRNEFLLSQNIDPQNLVLTDQIHSNIIKHVTKNEAGKTIDSCDGLFTDDISLNLGVFSADCVPIVMVSTKYQVKAIVHAGWKGLAFGIIENTTEMFAQFGFPPYEIHAYIAPHIRKCCYEVSKDFEKIFGADLLKDNKFDLTGLARNKLKKCGIRRIYEHKLCTKCSKYEDEFLFFSYRRDKTQERLLTVI
ncbi:MAG: peptidoglycan editing factor PgeF [Elusimicrobiota bacterium]|jgi:YfiH family protein|nr:peptidoglycan editing factor PgeF [Elusimicrobiota bacterium]